MYWWYNISASYVVFCACKWAWRPMWVLASTIWRLLCPWTELHVIKWIENCCCLDWTGILGVEGGFWAKEVETIELNIKSNIKSNGNKNERVFAYYQLSLLGSLDSDYDAINIMMVLVWGWVLLKNLLWRNKVQSKCG